MNEVEEVIETTTRITDRPLVQLRLHLVYPQLGLIEVGPQIAGIHQRSPRSPLMLRSCWAPSPCDRLSRPRTTTGPPPHPGSISRRRTFPPTSWLLIGEGSPGWFPRSLLTVRRMRRPAMPLRPRHAYAADIQRGLRGGDLFPPPEFPAQLLRVRVAIQPRSTRFELAGCLRGLQTLVSHVHLSGSPGALLRRGPLRTRYVKFHVTGCMSRAWLC